MTDDIKELLNKLNDARTLVLDSTNKASRMTLTQYDVNIITAYIDLLEDRIKYLEQEIDDLDFRGDCIE